MKDLSIIIPAYKDPYLTKTVEGILENFETDYEIIPVLDGADPVEPLPDHPDVKPIRLPENVGMREAINTGVRAAQGKYLMRTDAHCMFATGFDATILDTIKDNWIVDAKRYFLDPIQWKVMDKEPVLFEKLIIDNRYPKFAALPWKEKDEELKDVLLAPKMALQGSVWVMSHSWWDSVIGQLDSTGYGTLYQDTTEMLMKTWQAGGQLMLNKETWYAHKHRDFNRSHDYPAEKSHASWEYALETWRDYYTTTLKPRWGI